MHTSDDAQAYILNTLQELLAIPSPTGMTDDIVSFVCGRLNELEIPFELTRRGAIRACLLYTSPSPRDRQKSRMPSSA